MQDDNINGTDNGFADENGKNKNVQAGQDGKETPRWQPDPVKYNTTVVTEADKPKKRWLIPLCIVVGLMVVAICVGLFFGLKTLNEKIKDIEGKTPAASEEQGENQQGGELIISEGDKTQNDGLVVLTDVSGVVDIAMPSVVSVTSRALVYSGGYGGYWNYFFGNGGETREVEAGIGSGTIISSNDTELLILTSYHVVEDSSSLFVTFCDDTAVDGYIKAVSEADDIAVVAVPISDISKDTLDVIRIATISFQKPKVGDGVIVIGDALGYGQSVTTGIVSAVDRQITVDGKELTVIQTDAAINNGNSGGCMLNSRGEIIGISEAKISNSAVEGMCYAIEVSAYADKIEELVTQAPAPSTGNDETVSNGDLFGVMGIDIDRDRSEQYGLPMGVYVSSTIAGSGAEEAGVKAGDVIVGIDNVSLTTMDTLQSVLASHKPGDVVELSIYRLKNDEYQLITLKVKLKQRIS